jgi:prepilin-type processing-associated H-X9-DG protein
VVVAIISLLVSVTLPSLSRARLLAKRTACAASLRAVGAAAAMYEAAHAGYVPVCIANMEPPLPHPWKSWRTRLLDYTASYQVFNCPAGEDTEELGEIFHSNEEVTGFDRVGTANAGSYGVIEQFSLPSFRAIDFTGQVKQGNPIYSNAFLTTPGVAWRDPFNSVYVADSYLCKGEVRYPSQGRLGYGTSSIRPPWVPAFPGDTITRRFADRHAGTNCLFLGGHVLWYDTLKLDTMIAGEPECVWDVE